MSNFSHKLTGKIFDNKYAITEVIGSGGMSTVFKALVKGLDKVVAVKVLHDEGNAERFIREGQAMSRLNHPNIVEIFWLAKEHGFHYLVMKYIEGNTLSNIFQEKAPMELEEGLKLYFDILLAMEYCHNKGVIHRDLKPSNIMVDNWRHALIADFGLAKMDDVKKLTMSGMTLGTPEYISPEQIVGSSDLDHRTDIYSLGVILYVMFTGVSPFKGDLFQMLSKHLHEAPPKPRTLNSQIPAELESIILTCISKTPDERFDTVYDLRQALEGLVQKSQKTLLVPKIAKLKPIKLTPEKSVEPVKLAPSPIPPKSKSKEVASEITTYIRERNKIAIIEKASEIVDDSFRWWTFPTPSTETKIKNLIRIKKNMEQMLEIGLKVIDFLDPDLEECLDNSKGIIRQFMRIMERGQDKELQKTLMNFYRRAKSIRPLPNTRCLHPSFLTNQTLYDLYFLGAYSVKKEKSSVIMQLFETQTESIDGLKEPLVMFTNFIHSIESTGKTIMENCFDNIKGSKLFNYVNCNEEELQSILMKYDYLRCLWLFYRGQNYVPFYRFNTSERRFSAVAKAVRDTPDLWQELFGDDGYPLFRKFEMVTNKKFGHGTIKG